METEDRSDADPVFLLRAPPGVQVIPNLQLSPTDPAQLDRTEPRNNLPPLRNRSPTDPQRPGDIRGVLKVIKNVFFQHTPQLTTVAGRLQLGSTEPVLTLVNMAKLVDLAERLKDAMRVADVKPSELASICGTSRAAVTKWLKGETKELKADNLAAVAKRLGVREEWLSNGRLPRERVAGQEMRQAEKILSMIDGLREPIAALAKAMQELSEARTDESKRG